MLFPNHTYLNTRNDHKNDTKEEAIARIGTFLKEDFRQIEITAQELQARGLVSRQGRLTLKVRRLPTSALQNAAPEELLHNRKKK